MTFLLHLMLCLVIRRWNLPTTKISYMLARDEALLDECECVDCLLAMYILLA